jgi:hypothetical protein
MSTEKAKPTRTDDQADEKRERDPSDRPEVEPAFSVRQILGGFALLAALIVLLNRRRNRARAGDE